MKWKNIKALAIILQKLQLSSERYTLRFWQILVVKIENEVSSSKIYIFERTLGKKCILTLSIDQCQQNKFPEKMIFWEISERKS